MKPLVIQDETTGGKPTIYACAHWRSFPPPFTSSGLSAEDLRMLGYIKDPEYQRMLVWRRICGMQEMDVGKCMQCEHIRIAEVHKGLPVLTTMDGSHSVPAVDLPTLELNLHRIRSYARAHPAAGALGKPKER